MRQGFILNLNLKNKWLNVMTMVGALVYYPMVKLSHTMILLVDSWKQKSDDHTTDRSVQSSFQSRIP